MKTKHYTCKGNNCVILFCLFMLFQPVLHAQYYHGFYESDRGIYSEDKCFTGTIVDMGGFSEYIMVGTAGQEGEYLGLALNFTRTDANGGMLFGKTIKLYSVFHSGQNVISVTPTRIIRTSNPYYEEYALTGHVLGETSTDILFMLVDGSNGSVTLAKHYDFTINGTPGAVDAGNSISENFWGDFIIVGKTGNEVDGYNMAVLEIYGSRSLTPGEIRTSGTHDFSSSAIFTSAIPLVTRTDEIANDVVQDNDVTFSGNWNLFHVVGEIVYNNGQKVPFIVTMSQHLNLPNPCAIAYSTIRSGYDNYSFTRIKKRNPAFGNSYVILGYQGAANPQCIITGIDFAPFSFLNPYPTSWSNTFDHGLTDHFEIPFDVTEWVHMGSGSYEGQLVSEYFIAATQSHIRFLRPDDIEYAILFGPNGMIYYRADQFGLLMGKTQYEESGLATGKVINIDNNSSDPGVVIMGTANRDQQRVPSMLMVRAYFNGVSGIPGNLMCEYEHPYFADLPHNDNVEALASTHVETAVDYDFDYASEDMTEYVPCNDVWPGGNNSLMSLARTTTTGTKNQTITKESILVFPTYLQASANTITVKNLSGQFTPVSITCYDALGRSIRLTQVTTGQTTQVLFNNLAAGNYYLLINIGGTLSTHKFSKGVE